MKYLFILLFLAPFTVFAQFSKGTISLGGNISYTSISESYSATDYPSSNYLSLSPTVGAFISPSFSVGIFGQISSQKTPNINVVTNLFESQKSVSQIYGVFARKYFSISDNFLISLNGNIGLGNRMKNSDSTNKTDQFIASISPTLTFMPHEKWGIEASFGQISYETNSQQNPYYDSDRFTASLGSLSLGINYYINRKQ